MNSRSRIYVVILLVVCSASVCAFSLYMLRASLQETVKHEIHTLLKLVRQQAQYYVKASAEGLILREEAEKQVVDMLSAMNVGQDYIWSNDNQAIARVHIRDEIRGKFQKSYARHISKLKTKEIIFESDTNLKPVTDRRVLKLNGVVHLADWDWVIGYGVYIDDVEKRFWSIAIRIVLATLGFVVIALFALIYLFKARRD